MRAYCATAVASPWPCRLALCPNEERGGGFACLCNQWPRPNVMSCWMKRDQRGAFLKYTAIQITSFGRKSFVGIINIINMVACCYRNFFEHFLNSGSVFRGKVERFISSLDIVTRTPECFRTCLLDASHEPWAIFGLIILILKPS